jgi:ATP-dependent Lhr-like helicase
VPGVRVVYVSPLKALNNDVERNLQIPLAGIRAAAQAAGEELPRVRTAVRTGDTPANERQAMLRTPPHVLITTPESLYLMLTADRARAKFGTAHTVIVDEIHTLVGTKRGAHLAVSLERLERLSARRMQRIGLSATVRPLENAARFLGGQDSRAGHAPRPVTIVDANHKKAFDLRVVTPVQDFRRVPGHSVWNAIVPEVTRLVEAHRTTLVFCNNRRLAERTADRLNERRLLERTGLAEGKAPVALPDSGDLGMFAAGIDASKLAAAGLEPIRAHHGSMSKVARLEMERDLKSGALPALVATSSLELGIDIGDVDLVVQLQSPKSVASGLQRVGRSGHLVGQTSVGRIFPTHQEDVVEAAAVVRGMLRGEIEATATPENPLDGLAQHVMAMVATEDWDYDDLFAAVRGAYPYRNLGEKTFRSVVEMLSGKYPEAVSRQLAARISWDRVNNRLAALPGSRFLAIQSGGTIPDRGAYSLVLGDRKTKIGELDEEFVFESRPGDTFLLGSQVWRVTEITDDRVIAEPAPGEIPRMPFWHGDHPWRPYDLGKRIGAFRATLAEMLIRLTPDDLHRLRELDEASFAALVGDDGNVERLLAFLRDECALDRNAAVHIVEYLRGQLDATGQIATDRSVLVEVYEDAIGDPRMAVHSPFGGRVNGPWGIALAAAVREQTGADPQVITSDDGILLRFAGADVTPPADIVSRLTSQEARERLLADLPNSAVFGAQFRMNAARALLLPRQSGGKRTPLWLSRLRAKDLMQAVQRFEDFPIILETFRDCLRDVMDLDGLAEVLDRIQRGEIHVTVHESEFPSPLATGLDYRMAMQYMYEYDAPRGERNLAALSVDRSLLAELLQDGTLAELLKPAAVQEIVERVSRTASDARARSAEELAQLLYEIGDLSEDEIAARCAGAEWPQWIEGLAAAGRVKRWSAGSGGVGDAGTPSPQASPTGRGSRGMARPEQLVSSSLTRWVAAERLAEYENLHWDPVPVLRRWLMHAGPTTAGELAARYGLSEDVVERCLVSLAPDLVSGTFEPGAGEQWLDRRTLEQMHRRTLGLLRKEVRPVPLGAYAEFLRGWQHAGDGLAAGNASLSQVLQQLRGFAVPAVAWERDVLPARVAEFDSDALAERCQAGEVVWVAEGNRDPRRARVRFFFRGEGGLFLERRADAAMLEALSEPARAVYDFLAEEGAALLPDVADGTELERVAIQAALVELVLAGLVTNDTLAGLHAIVGYEPPASERPGLRSTLEAQLAALRPDRRGRPSTRYGWRDAKRSAREAVATRSQVPPRDWVGRWSLVHRSALLGKPLSPDEVALRQARQLLARWGVVTKACLEREAIDWEGVYAVLARLELRGEVRRGYFVEGLPGLQFALPEAVERLRAANGEREAAEPAIAVLSAVDPAQFYGTEAAGGPLRFQRVPSTAVAFARGEPVAAMEDNGAGVVATGDDPALVPALRALARWWADRNGGRLKLERWQGEPVLGSDGIPFLEAAGFARDYGAMFHHTKARIA